MSKPIHIASTNVAIWCDTYRGRQIATYKHSLGWSVYIDQVKQANRTFATIKDAIRWLRRELDDAAFDSRVAVLCSRQKPRQRRRMFVAT
jgi:hypothetical protein